MEKDPAGYEKCYGYDAAGNKIWETDKEKHVKTNYEYDGFYRLKRVDSPEGIRVEYTYNALDSILTQTIGGSQTTVYTYDGLNRLTSKRDPSGRVESYNSYDNAGNLLSRTDRNGRTTSYEYDSFYRLKSETVDDAYHSQRTYKYDKVGNLIEETSRSISQYSKVMTYDDLNRLLTKELPGGNKIEYTYEDAEHKEIMTDPAGNKTIYSYDKMNRLEIVTTDERDTVYTYDANGNRKSLTYPSGITALYEYDSRNLLVRLTNYTKMQVKTAESIEDKGEYESLTVTAAVYHYPGKGIEKIYEYQYDGNGMQTCKIEPKGKTEFIYDDAGRIKTVIEPDGKKTTYTYDSFGNRKTQRTEGDGLLVDIQYIYDNSNRLVKTIEMNNNMVINTEYGYDNNGNQISVKEFSSSGNKTSTYEYDGFNQMVKARTTEGKNISCNYDALGLRVSKTADGKTTNYYYRYGSVILEKTGDNSIRNVVGVNLIARGGKEDILYYVYNGHGDVIELQSSGGGIVNEYDYDIFGNPTLENEAEGKENPYRYAGYYWDKETGYYYLRTRYYDPEIARFITEDSFTGYYDDPLSLNLYTYCMNSPINYWDPDGRYYVTDPVTGEKIHASEWESRRNFRAKVRDSQGRGVFVSTGVSAYDWALQNKVNKGTGNGGTYTYKDKDGNTVTKEWTITNDEFLDSNALTQAEITEICRKKNPGLVERGFDKAIYEYAQKKGINPKVILATLAQEQKWCKNGRYDKAFGVGPGGNPSAFAENETGVLLVQLIHS